MARKFSSRFLLLALALAVMQSSSKAAEAVGRDDAAPSYSAGTPAQRIPRSNWVGVFGCIGIMTVARRKRRFLI